jgi:hypothetical protein
VSSGLDSLTYEVLPRTLGAWMAVEHDVPDEALERHTIRGRSRARGWQHFKEHAAHLERHEPTPGKEHWDRLGYQVIQGRAEVVNPPVPRPDQEPQLFE